MFEIYSNLKLPKYLNKSFKIWSSVLGSLFEWDIWYAIAYHRTSFQFEILKLLSILEYKGISKNLKKLF